MALTMITLHHLNNSRSQRILWLMEELGLPYEIQRYQRDPRTMLAPPSLRAVHPLGKSPVITDGELTLAESGAIIDYLVARYGAGRLAPAAGTADHLRYTYWMHYAEGSAMPPLLLKLVFDKVENSPMPFFAKPIARAIAGKVKKPLSSRSSGSTWTSSKCRCPRAAGLPAPSFSGADIQMSFPLEAAAARGGLNESRPRLMDFLARIHARPAYQRAIERGGEFGLR
jgi:glutathione S-transferase